MAFFPYVQVNLKLVDWKVMTEWITKRITQLMGMEEEVFIGMVLNHLENLEVRSSERRQGCQLSVGIRASSH